MRKIADETRALEAFSRAVENHLASFQAFGRVWQIIDGQATVFYKYGGVDHRITFRAVSRSGRAIRHMAAQAGHQIVEIVGGKGGAVDGRAVDNLEYEVTRLVVDTLPGD